MMTEKFGELFLVAFLTGISIKLLDDFIDMDLDIRKGLGQSFANHPNFFLPYGFITLIIACFYQPYWAGALFLGAYAVGMFPEGSRVFPLQLKGITEIIGAFLIGLLYCGWHLTAAAFLLMLAIQLFDDILDKDIDFITNSFNWAAHLGQLETQILTLILIMLAWLLFPAGVLNTLVAYVFLEGVIRIWQQA